MVKMRLVKNPDDAVCSCCGCSNDNSLAMFDLALGKSKIRLCDVCVGILFQKTLKATCMVESKLKTQADLAIVRRRKHRDGTGGFQ